jgi:ABC-2 type transport system ATP-binding protein
MLVVDHISRFFGEKKALDDVAFDVAPGEVVGVLGPNGAGKSTLLRTLGGILEPTSGDVRFNGKSTFPPTPRVFGFLSEEAPLYPDMTATEFLTFRGRLKGFRGKRLFIRMREMEETAGLKEFGETPCGKLSAGQRRRLALADAMLTHPQVLLLDALFDNLDVFHAKRIQSALAARAAKTCILISGHNLHALAEICTRFMTFHKGRCTATLSVTETPPEKLHTLLACSITEAMVSCG